MLMDHVERQQRVPQMVEHAHEQHQIEPFPETADVIDRPSASVSQNQSDDAEAKSFSRCSLSHNAFTLACHFRNC
jgi:hypothetical protein